MKIVALAGGVGGAKLVEGLARVLPPEDLAIVVNTGDDFEHLGFFISPDVDTVCYTLAGLANPDTGWGRRDETFRFMHHLHALGGPDWFQLGDSDLATHVERSRRMKNGQKLSKITQDFCKAWGVKPAIFPMSDQPVHTIVETVEDGELDFQEYFVHRKCRPQVKGFRFEGILEAHPAPGILEAIRHAEAVVICPSNPWVSIDPILAIPGLLLTLTGKLVVAVSPIIGGQTVKGPAAKMFVEMGLLPSALSVASHYGKFLSGFLIDNIDTELVAHLLIPTCVTKLLMTTSEDRLRLAEEVIRFIMTLGRK